MVYNSKYSNEYKLLHEIRDILANNNSSGGNTDLVVKLEELENRLDNLIDTPSNVFNPDEYYGCPNPNMKITVNISDGLDRPLEGYYNYADSTYDDYNLYPITNEGNCVLNIRKPIKLGNDYGMDDILMTIYSPQLNDNRTKTYLYYIMDNWMIEGDYIQRVNVGEWDDTYGVWVIGDSLPDELIIYMKQMQEE